MIVTVMMMMRSIPGPGTVSKGKKKRSRIGVKPFLRTFAP